MKSFKKFISEGRKEFIEKQKQDIETIRKRLEKTPTLSDAEMRAQNPKATAAYEKEVARKKALGGSTKTIKTPEGKIITNMPKGASTPEEVLSRLENKPKAPSSTSRPSTGGKPKVSRKISKPSGRLLNPPVEKSSVSKPAFKSDLELPKSTRTAAQKAKPGLYKVPTSRQLPKPAEVKVPSLPKTVSKPASVKPTAKPPTLKPKAIVPKQTSTQSMGKVVKDVLKTERQARSAERSAFAAGAKKALGNVGKAAGIVGAGIEAKQAYDVARREGASKRRSIGAGAARAIGGLAGGALGSAAGSILGVPGSVAGGVAGYQAGTEFGTKAYRALTGDPGKKLTTKGLQTNIRKAVPYEIRKQVPGQVRKGFSDFVTQAGKTYGQWSKSQGKVGNR